MTQTSGFWTTNGTGDGTGSGYALSALATFFNAVFLDDETAQGPLLGYLNALAVSGSATPVTVATGAAVVKGLWYVNDASTTVTVTTPSGATRIDRIVLEVAYSAQTVRVVRVAGSEGGAAPALTQSAGVTWQISLAQVSITTGGVITVTDERQYAVFNTQVKTANLAADAVTGAKLADDSVDSEHYVDGSIDTAHIANLQITTALLAADSVDDTKAGDRVPQMYRRQGGSATNWNTGGSTTYTPGAVRMQAGTARYSGAPVYGAQITVTFPTAFSAVPVVLATVYDSQAQFLKMWVAVDSVTTSGCVLRTDQDGTTFASIIDVFWLAIGTE